MASEAISPPYAVVVGGVNMDIGGMPFGPLRGSDSNPGVIRAAVGGVGQNIARNLALLGVPVHFLTAFGWDENGAAVARTCESAGIDLSSALRLRDAATSVYLYIADEKGEMQLAVSDMAVCDSITPEYLAQHERLLNGAGGYELQIDPANPLTTKGTAKILVTLEGNTTGKPDATVSIAVKFA